MRPALSAAPRPVWARRLGYVHRVQGIAVDADGNVAICGLIGWPTDLGAGPIRPPGVPPDPTFFVVVLDEHGRARWSRAFGSAGLVAEARVAFDPAGNVVLAGHTTEAVLDLGLGPLKASGTQDVFVAKLDRTGRTSWAKRFGGSLLLAAAEGLAVDLAGDIVLVGWFMDGRLDFGLGPMQSAGGRDAYVVRLDPRGAPRWNLRFGDAFADAVSAVAVDRAGNAIVAGSFEQSVDFGLGPLRSAGGPDVFVAEIDAAGRTVWARRFGGAGWDAARAVAVDGSGNIALTGATFTPEEYGAGPHIPGGNNAFVAVLDRSGRPRWARHFPPGAMLDAPSAAFDAAGNLVLEGLLTQAVDFGSGMRGVTRGDRFDQLFVAVFARTGLPLWSAAFAGTTLHGGTGVAVDRRTGQVVFTGIAIAETVDFGGGAVSGGEGDALAVKLSAPAP